MNCLVTGASGFIGSALIKRLINEGHTVKGLVHKIQPQTAVQKADYVLGDITDRESLQYIVEDVDVIFHCAALVKDFGLKDSFYKINFEGTKNIVEVCSEYNIKRFVFLSHIRYEAEKKFEYYSLSKAMAEQYLLDKHKNDGFPVVIMRPGNVYGPRATTWVLRPLRAIQKNKIALIDKGSGIFLHTYIDNLIDALLNAMQEPKAIGETIDITDGDNSITWGEYLNALAEIAGKNPIKRNMSKNTALILGKIMILLYNLFRIEPMVTPMAVEVFTNQNKISIEKAKSLLEYEPKVDFKEGMKQVENWLKSEGYIV